METPYSLLGHVEWRVVDETSHGNSGVYLQSHGDRIQFRNIWIMEL